MPYLLFKTHSRPTNVWPRGLLSAAERSLTVCRGYSYCISWREPRAPPAILLSLSGASRVDVCVLEDG